MHGTVKTEPCTFFHDSYIIGRSLMFIPAAASLKRMASSLAARKLIHAGRGMSKAHGIISCCAKNLFVQVAASLKCMALSAQKHVHNTLVVIAGLHVIKNRSDDVITVGDDAVYPLPDHVLGGLHAVDRPAVDLLALGVDRPGP